MIADWEEYLNGARDRMMKGVKEIDDTYKSLIIWINKMSVSMKSNNGKNRNP